MASSDTASSSSSDEFEDAKDELGPLPDLSAAQNIPKVSSVSRENRIDSRLQKPEVFPRSSDVSHMQPSTSTYVNLTSSLSSPLGKESASVSRRSRLSVLRGRMQKEFGGVLQGNLNSVEDETGSTSESASLASWGRNLIMEHSPLTVGPFFPADSISTKAFSLNGTLGNDGIGPKMVVQTENNGLQVPSRNTADPLSKPPSRPPPPLPSSPCPPAQTSIQLPPFNATPPPLPPRNPALRLPAALSPQVVSVVSESPPSTCVRPPVNVLNEHEVTTVSNESTNSTNYARGRGHAKTNSLDRGLSLAKCLKTGPFPPPASKSNSLKREYSTECADASSFISLDGCEEDIRNSDAQGVIHQITSSILKEDTFKEQVSTPSVFGGGDEGLSAVDENSLGSYPNSTFKSETKEEVDDCFMVRNISSLSEAKKEEADLSSPEKNVSMEKPVQEKEVEEGGENMVESPELYNGGIDPISRDLERRNQQGSDQDDTGSKNPPTTISSIGRAAHFVKEYGTLASGILRGAVNKAKNVVSSSGAASKLPKEDDENDNDSEREEAESVPIVRPKSAKRGPFDFDGTRVVQELNNEHTGAVWCMKFSICGRLLATAGQDNIVRVWVLRNHLAYFNSMRERYNAQCKQSSNMSIGDGVLRNAMQQIEKDLQSSSTRLGDSAGSMCSREDDIDNDSCSVMAAKPLCTYRGHTADILDLSWSRNYFILSSGMDRTVKLWHLSRPECLCCFQHMDFVTCVAFMPKDDRYFLSGSLDGKLRLWHIPDKKVALWNEVEQVKFITAMAFVKGGKFAVVGTFDGRCIFYSTDQLKYYTVIDVRSSRSKNSRKRKVTGLSVHGDKLLVTSNDSRIRMYDVRDMALTCKFKGAVLERSQIPAAFSPDGKHIVCGSEDHNIYIWSTTDLNSSLSVRRDRIDAWQRIRCHSACVSAAIFAPRPSLFLSLLEHRRGGEEKKYETSGHAKPHDRQIQGDVIISADLQGSIKILANRTRIKAGGSNFFSTGVA